jgi:hypothetical protein
MGGETTGGARNATAWRYNVPTNSWSPIADAPNIGVGNGGVSNAGAAAVGTKVYLPGGYDGTAGTGRMAIYDTVANSWTTGTAMPFATFGHTVASIGNFVYVVGGDSAGAAGTNLYRYDTVGDLWTLMNPMSTARNYAAAANIGGMLYVAGGTPADLTSVEVYNPNTNTWSAAPSMNEGRGGGGLYDLNGNAYAVSGGWGSYLTTSEELNGGTWNGSSPVNFGSRTFAYAGNAQWLVKAGGWNGGYMDQVEFVNAVPEPATFVVLGGLLLLGALRRRK